MVLGVVTGCYLVSHAACHRNSTETCCTDKRIDLLLCKEIEYLHHADASRYRQCESKEAANDDADGLEIEECLARHRGTHGESQEDSGSIHDGIAGSIEEATSHRAQFLQQVAEHQHADKADGSRNEECHDDGNSDWEKYLQGTEVLYLCLVRIFLVLFLHVDEQFLLGTQQLHHKGYDDRHQSHVGICRNGNRSEQFGCQLDGSKDSRRSVGTAYDAEGSSLLGREAHGEGTQQYGKDAKLCSGTEDRQAQIAKHGTEVGQCSDTHEDDWRNEARLDAHIIDEVHQAQLMGNLMQGHIPYHLLRTVRQGDNTLRRCL